MNAYAVAKGAKAAEVVNYFEEDCPTVLIPLDEKLGAQANAQRYYKKYKKLKTAEEILQQQLALARGELAYLDTLREAMEKVETEAELEEIRTELSLKKTEGRKQGKAPKLSPPMRFEKDGFTVLCGKNNQQNDTLTFRTAERHDIWCHAKDRPGSHVLVRAEGRPVPDSVLTFACEVAALYSSAKGGNQVPVDYTLACRVKKPSGARPGFVNYFDQKTAYVTPDEAAIAQARQS